MKNFLKFLVLTITIISIFSTNAVSLAAEPQSTQYLTDGTTNLSYSSDKVTFENGRAQLIPRGLQFEWQKTWTELGLDPAWRIATDQEGNLYTKGNIGANPNHPFVAKLNSSMERVWTYTDNPGANYVYHDYGRLFYDKHEGHIYTGGGIKDSTTGQWYWYVLALDADGNKLWSDIRIMPGIIGAANMNTDTPSYIQFGANAFGTDSFGNLYAGGISGDTVSLINHNAHLKVIKYDSDGNTIWDKMAEKDWTFPAEIDDTTTPKRQISGGGAWDISVDGNGNVYTTGPGVLLPWPGRGEDYVTTKIDSDGDMLWARAWSNTGNKMDRSEGISVDRNGNVYVGGFADGGGTPITVMYDNNGNQMWVRNAFNDNSDLASTSKGAILGTIIDYMGNYYGYGYNNDNSSLLVSYDSAGKRTYFAGGVTFPTGSNSGWNIAAANGYIYITTGSDSGLVPADGIVRYKYTFPNNLRSSFVIQDPNVAVEYRNLYSFAENASGPGQIKYQVSFNGKLWYWWNGTKWALAQNSFAEANTAEKLNNRISTFPKNVSIGKLYVRVFLDRRSYTELKSLTIGYDNIPRKKN